MWPTQQPMYLAESGKSERSRRDVGERIQVFTGSVGRVGRKMEESCCCRKKRGNDAHVLSIRAKQS